MGIFGKTKRSRMYDHDTFDKNIYDEDEDNDEEVRIHTINNVYDFDKLTADDRQDLFGFWRNCVPIYK